MRLLKVSFPSIYAWGDASPEAKLKAETEQAARAEQIARIVGEANAEAGTYASFDGLLVTQEQYFAFISEGVKFSTLEVITIHEGGECFVAASERSKDLSSHERAFNQLVNVHISNSALITYNAVELLADGCTDALQHKLDHGWRIIAACVQPDGRRPDYILGRYEAQS